MNSLKSGKKRASKKRSRKNKKLPFAIGLCAIVAIVIAAVYILGFNGSSSPAGTVLLQTTMGNITIQLRNDRPITTGNFKNIVRQGVYDGTIFHRVIADFMIQGGDPTGTGYGDPSIPNIKDELDGNNLNIRGTIAMANTGLPDTGSSQFFINVVDNNYLDTKHSVFGTVISGMEVVDEISRVDTDANKPLIDVKIIKAEIIG
jgi:cyclophilin family peptidyl-prolyl cis-trans isomerase